MSDHQSIIEFKQLIQSEIGDFFAGIGQLGEPVKPEIMQKLLLENIENCFAGVSETKKEDFSYEAAKELIGLSTCHLNCLRGHLDHHRQDIERYLLRVEENLEEIDYDLYQAWKKDAVKLGNLYRVLSREIERVAGL
ncbi:hypothetical protein [Shewanella sp. S23-S33]|uniref:hypothetical protein n=1 Tax=Shewanella sp. S23-S33 TaxID=3342769 RepID=UPI00372D3707